MLGAPIALAIIEASPLEQPLKITWFRPKIFMFEIDSRGTLEAPSIPLNFDTWNRANWLISVQVSIRSDMLDGLGVRQWIEADGR